MTHLNIEIKARCSDPQFVRTFLNSNRAEFIGIDHQTDTYFNVQSGRMKLREGNIENSLIYYERKDEMGAKESNFQLIPVQEASALKSILARALGIKMVVAKKREIYFIGNVKFHIDDISGLGNFVEIEASNFYENVPKEELQRQCNFYVKEFGIKNEDLIPVSYSDMLLASPELSAKPGTK